MKTYITTNGERWDSVAKKVYDSELYADYLMANNLDKLDMFSFPSGVELATPELTEDLKTTNSLPDWRS